MGMMMMCPVADTVACTMKTKACQDEEKDEKDDPESIKCICACPDFLSAFGAMAKGDMKPVCNNQDKTIGCMAGESSCASMTKDVNPGQIKLMCEMDSSGCLEKMGKCKESDAEKQWDET